MEYQLFIFRLLNPCCNAVKKDTLSMECKYFNNNDLTSYLKRNIPYLSVYEIEKIIISSKFSELEDCNQCGNCYFIFKCNEEFNINMEEILYIIKSNLFSDSYDTETSDKIEECDLESYENVFNIYSDSD